MCYDIKTKLAFMLKRARHQGDEDRIRELEEAILPYLEDEIFHASGFSHPKLLIYTKESPFIPELATWGLIPSWVKGEEQKMKLWNSTLNARGETIFEKPSFKYSARNNRAVIYLKGFYEHHHQSGKSYPFLIERKDSEPVILGCLASSWVDKNTGEIIKSFSIVTTKGNELMGKIHNNPKLKEPRMPLILREQDVDVWLNHSEDQMDIEDVLKMIQPFDQDLLKAHSVQRLRGKERLGNVKEAADPFVYEELELKV